MILKPSLVSLRALVPRRIVRRRLPLPVGVQLHGWTICAYLRPTFIKAFGPVIHSKGSL